VTTCTGIQVSIPSGGADRLTVMSQLSDRLAQIPDTGYAEIWVDHDPFPSMCALLNGRRGWLMFLRYDGDAGFSSRNPNYGGDPAEEIDYILENGQRDLYPASWAYPKEEVVAALEAFARSREVPGIAWFNDAADGAASPSDPVEPHS